MKYDVVIIGAGPAGIFTAIELIRKGANKKIMMVEKGQPIEKRRCPKSKTNKCVNCKPYCHITTGFSGAGAKKPAAAAQSYSVGETVKHKAYGTGVILSMQKMANDTMLEIAFEKVGTKKIMANYAKLEKV